MKTGENMNISKRLERIAEFVPKGSIVADIGSDHGFVPIHLITEGKIHRAVAGEVNEGPFQRARANIAHVGLQKQIDVRKGNGLEVLAKGEVSVIVIAGMGGGTIVTILASGMEKLEGVKRLILQPQGDADHVRTWLTGNGWAIIDEDLILEDQVLYEIIVAEHGEQQLSEQETEFGPVLLQTAHPLLQRKIDQEMERTERVIRNVTKSKGEGAERKLEVMEQRKHWLQEVGQRVRNSKGNHGDI